MVRVLIIIKEDSQVKEILEKTTWQVLHIGPSTKGSQGRGAIALIRLDKPVWVEGTYYNPFAGRTLTVKMWVGSLHVIVDLSTNQVIGLDLGMGKAVERTPVQDEKLAAAERIARGHRLVQSLGQNVESYLTAVYYTADYPQGLAIFSIRSTRGEVLVAVDLGTMAVVEKYTVKVVTPRP
jgi:hypothetical protein